MIGPIIERPIRPYVRLETLNPISNPFILGVGRLGGSKLGAAGSTITWTDWTDHVMNIDMRRGGTMDGLTHRNQTGTLSVTLRDVIIDPQAPEFVTGQRIRLTYVNGATTYPLFTGEVSEADAATLRVGREAFSILTVVAIDNVKKHEDTTRYGALPEAGSETFAQRVARLAGTATAPLGTPPAGIGNWGGQEIMLGRTVYESSIRNHLDIACATIGAMWWVDGAGVTQFRRRVHPDNTFPGSGPIFVDRNKVVPASSGPDPWPYPVLRFKDTSAAHGSRALFTGIDYANHGAREDLPDHPGSWVADDRTLPGFRVAQAVGRYGLLTDTVETNFASVADTTGTLGPNNWVVPYAGGWVVNQLTWNAQEDITKIPALDVGSHLQINSMGDTGSAPEYRYLIAGVRHVITRKRWMLTLDLIGANT